MLKLFITCLLNLRNWRNLKFILKYRKKIIFHFKWKIFDLAWKAFGAKNLYQVNIATDQI